MAQNAMAAFYGAVRHMDLKGFVRKCSHQFLNRWQQASAGHLRFNYSDLLKSSKRRHRPEGDAFLGQMTLIYDVLAMGIHFRPFRGFTIEDKGVHFFTRGFNVSSSFFRIWVL